MVIGRRTAGMGKKGHGTAKEAVNKSARADSERFFLSRRFQKRWNTVSISHFWNCTAEKNDPLLSRRRYIQRFLRFAALGKGRLSEMIREENF